MILWNGNYNNVSNYEPITTYTPPLPRASHPRHCRHGPLLPGGWWPCRSGSMGTSSLTHPTSWSHPGGTSLTEWTCPPLPHGICCSHSTTPFSNGCNPTNDGFPPLAPTLLTPPEIPPSLPLRPLHTIAHGGVMDRHAVLTPSWYNAASETPTHAPLVRGWAHCSSAAIAATTMPWSPLRPPVADPSGLLPPPVGRRRWQHLDVDASLRRPRPRCIEIGAAVIILADKCGWGW